MTDGTREDEAAGTGPVPQKDSLEFSSGLLLGALVGAGLALLVAPDRSPRGRFVRRLRKPRRRVRRQAVETREVAGDATRESAMLARELKGLGLEVAKAFRQELVGPLLDRFSAGGRSGGARARLDRASGRLRELRKDPGILGKD